MAAQDDEVVVSTSGATRRRRRRAVPDRLDDVDREIVALLMADGRCSTREVAARVGLGESTVASRIRHLRSCGVMRVTALCDWEAAGLGAALWVGIEIEGRPIRDVGADVAALPGMHFALGTLGSVDVVALVLLTDLQRAASFLAEDLAQVVGVQRVAADIVLTTTKYTAGQYSLVPERAAAPELPNPVVPLDEVDRGIVGALVDDGRRSNRDIGRGLGVSEATVRTRLRRLEQAGLIRIVAQVDPVRAGYVGASALVGVEVVGPNLAQVAQHLQGIDEVIMAVTTTGRYQLKLFTVAATRRDLVDVIVERIRRIPGVRSTETWDVFAAPRSAEQWGRLL